MTYALLPYQQAWLADKSQVKLFTKSRRIGISWAEAADAALTASRKGGMNITYLCYDEDITRQFVKDCADWARVYNLAASEISQQEEVFRDENEERSILVFRIYFASGFEVQAIAGVPRKLRGRKGRVIIDEAAFADEFAAAKEAALALLIWGGDLHIITTYNGIENDYYEFEQEVLAGKWPDYSRHFCDFRGAIQQGLYQRICLVNGWEWSAQAEQEFIEGIYRQFGDIAEQELDCIPKYSGGNYFSLAVLERSLASPAPVLGFTCDENFLMLPSSQKQERVQSWLRLQVLPALEANLKPHLRTYLGMDFARTTLSVICIAQEGVGLGLETALGLELRNVPFEEQWLILKALIEACPDFAAAALDARGNGAQQAERAVLVFGLNRIHAIQATSQWYGEWFPKYRAKLEEGNFLLPKNANWRDDHRLVIEQKGKPTVPDKSTKGTDGKSRHGDAAIACLLTDYASRHSPSPIEFKAVSKPSFAAQIRKLFIRSGM